MRKSKQSKSKAVNYKLIEQRHEAYDMLRELVRKHHDHLAEANIALAWRYGMKPDKDGRLTLGQCRKATDLSRELVDYDFVIVLNYEVWTSSEFGGSRQMALLDHELMHAQVSVDDETGELKTDDRGRIVYRIRKHDLEEFRDIVKRHGLYKQDLEEFAKVMMESKKTPLLKVANG